MPNHLEVHKSYIMYMYIYVQLWQYGLWSFQTGGTKLERFLPKNQHTQRKLLNFENWFFCQKVQNHPTS